MEDVTALILTYNQEGSIGPAIESVLSQSMVGRMRIIVSDDASSDSTLENAKSAVDRYSDVNIDVRQNLKNLGTMQHYRSVTGTVTTPFLAILEGDDLWISPTKVERQVALLKSMDDACVCFTACELVKNGNTVLHPAFAAAERFRNLEVADLLNENSPGTFSNCVYRTDKFKRALNLSKDVRGFDWIVNLLLASEGPVLFDPFPSTRYHSHPDGQWSRLSRDEQTSMLADTLNAFDALTGSRFGPFVKEAKKRFCVGV